MDSIRRIDFFLQNIIPKLSNKSILLIGNAPEKLRARFESKQVQFTGKITYKDIPNYLSKAHYGLNLIPDIYPFNIQPSLKLLEYCARGLNIITTDYEWLREFEIKQGARFFKLDAALHHFSIPQIEQFNYRTPGLIDSTWKAALDRSQLLSLLPPPSG